METLGGNEIHKCLCEMPKKPKLVHNCIRHTYRYGSYRPRSFENKQLSDLKSARNKSPNDTRIYSIL